MFVLIQATLTYDRKSRDRQREWNKINEQQTRTCGNSERPVRVDDIVRNWLNVGGWFQFLFGTVYTGLQILTMVFFMHL